MPVVSFEVGQYCVYPDVDSVSDYTGNLLPANFEFIKQEMIKHNVYHMLEEYKNASGKFAALMYKEDIEASLRTHHMGGFQLLGLCDYTGQGTATIGLLDVFWNSKNIITSKQFRHFCSPVVPLMKANRIFMNTDKFEAEFDLYDYGKDKIKFPVFNLALYDGDTKIYETKTRRKRVSFPLDFITKSTCINAVLSVNDYSNSWNIFVYKKEDKKYPVTIIKNIGEGFNNIVENGGKAIFMMSEKNLRYPIEGLFKPAFWSPAHFPSDRACGLICDASHGIFEHFPTSSYADFQWKHPIDNSVSPVVASLPQDFKYIIEPVPNFYNNIRRSPLFEAKVGNADILFCGFDLNVNKPTVKALKNSIFNYVLSDSFSPEQRLTKDDIDELFK